MESMTVMDMRLEVERLRTANARLRTDNENLKLRLAEFEVAIAKLVTDVRQKEARGL